MTVVLKIYKSRAVNWQAKSTHRLLSITGTAMLLAIMFCVATKDFSSEKVQYHDKMWYMYIHYNKYSDKYII